MDNIRNHYSYLTAKERDKISFPSSYLLNRNLIHGKTLDFGCGLGKDVECLREERVDIHGYDKYYFTKWPNEKYDTILCIYVLNVLLPEEQMDVIMEVSQLLKPSGKAYFAVRRDLKNFGFRTHKLHKKHTYQCNVKLNFKSILKNEFCEIYEYKHFNKIRSTSECIFCNPDREIELLLESATAYAIFDKFPVSLGHLLIIPKRHVKNYFDLSLKEQIACVLMLNKAKSIIDKRYSPQGYNIGVNINQVAGQTVEHVHIHLIPRYKGDVENPIGGIRGVIPSKKEY